VDSKCPISNASRQEITCIKFKAAIRVFSLSKNASTNPAGTSGRFSSHICLTHLAVSDTFFFLIRKVLNAKKSIIHLFQDFKEQIIHHVATSLLISFFLLL